MNRQRRIKRRADVGIGGVQKTPLSFAEALEIGANNKIGSDEPRPAEVTDPLQQIDSQQRLPPWNSTLICGVLS